MIYSFVILFFCLKHYSVHFPERYATNVHKVNLLKISKMVPLIVWINNNNNLSQYGSVVNHPPALAPLRGSAGGAGELTC